MNNTINNLYIPKKIKVGFQHRNDCYQKRLSYIIYYGQDGKIRKEKSWESWRDKTIESEEYDNIPTDGFVFNKNVQRYNWSHFVSGRSLIRVFDPRGLEFEITTENLIMVLMNTDCSKRGLVGKFVYSWAGPELVLLPVSCEEYEKAIGYTDLQKGKIGAKDMVPGCSYKTKKGEDLIYVGKFHWFTWNLWGNEPKPRSGRKFYIFTLDGKTFETKSGLDFLSSKISDVVSNYAEIIENFQNNHHSSKIVKFEAVPVDFCLDTKETPYYGPQLIKSSYFDIRNNVLTQYNIKTENKYEYNKETGKNKYVFFNKYSFVDSYQINTDTQTVICLPQYRSSWGSSWGYSQRKITILQKADIEKLKFCDLYVVFENGKRIKVDDLNQLC